MGGWWAMREGGEKRVGNEGVEGNEGGGPSHRRRM